MFKRKVLFILILAFLASCWKDTVTNNDNIIRYNSNVNISYTIFEQETWIQLWSLDFLEFKVWNIHKYQELDKYIIWMTKDESKEVLINKPFWEINKNLIKKISKIQLEKTWIDINSIKKWNIINWYEVKFTNKSFILVDLNNKLAWKDIKINFTIKTIKNENN